MTKTIERRVPIDRSRVLAETYPGAKNDVEAMVEDSGGWICEQHPGKPWPHDDCGGPGMTKAE